MADFMKILQQVKDMQGRFETIQKELEAKSVTGTAGGGMVTVEADGKGTVKRVKIDPSVVNPQDVEMLEDATVSLVTERRSSRPWGLDGGEPGAPGENWLLPGGHEPGAQRLTDKCTVELRAGDVLRVFTPGGGGYGRQEQEK